MHVHRFYTINVQAVPTGASRGRTRPPRLSPALPRSAVGTESGTSLTPPGPRRRRGGSDSLVQEGREPANELFLNNLSDAWALSEVEARKAVAPQNQRYLPAMIEVVLDEVPDDPLSGDRLSARAAWA